MKNAVIDRNEKIEEDVQTLLNKADNIIQNTISNIKNEIITMYFNIGEMIVTYKNNNSSKYGESIVTNFVNELNLKHGNGFSKSNIYSAIKFYEIFQKFQTSGKFIYKNLTWSHIIEILNLNEIPKEKELLKIINDNKIILLKIENLKLEELESETSE